MGLYPQQQALYYLLDHPHHLAQQRMKVYADKKRVEREFEVGDFVYLKLQPYRQQTVALRRHRLQLPPGARIHPVFHVSLLKKVLSPTISTTPDLPVVDQDGAFVVAPVAVLQERKIQRGTSEVTQVLISWDENEGSCTSWEDLKFIRRKFPHFDPWGQGSQERRGIVVNSVEKMDEKKGSMEKLVISVENNKDGIFMSLSLVDEGWVKEEDDGN